MYSHQTILSFATLVISLALACAGGADIASGAEDGHTPGATTTSAVATLDDDRSTESSVTAAEGSGSPVPDPTSGASTGSAGPTTGDQVPNTGGEGTDTSASTGTDSMGEDLSYCGDGALDPGELCDDGNQIDDDTCTVGCIPYYCGNGIIDQGYSEECDDGNLIGTDGCTTECKLPKCGDGYVQAGVEECDDLNSSNYDICLSNCTIATCGDSFLWKYDLTQGQKTEQCDDGDNNGPCPAPCSATCEYNFPNC